MLQIRRMPVGQIGTNCYLLEDPETKTGFIQVVNNSCNPDDRCVLYPHFAQNAVYTFEESNNDGSFEITDDGRFIVTMQKANSAVWFYSYQ